MKHTRGKLILPLRKGGQRKQTSVGSNGDSRFFHSVVKLLTCSVDAGGGFMKAYLNSLEKVARWGIHLFGSHRREQTRKRSRTNYPEGGGKLLLCRAKKERRQTAL